MTTKTYDAIIIGAGHNGLVCSYYLARKGLSVCVLERSSVVGGAALTEEFHPDYRNSVAAYTVSLLQPKVIRDMELEKHGLEVVLRKVDNYLPLGTKKKDGYLLGGRDGLTLREIARHSEKDAEAYPRYEAALDGIVALLKQFLLVAPPNMGGGLADVLSLLSAGNKMRKLSTETHRDLLDFFTKSATEILEQYFENDAVKALFGFDAIVGHFASPNEPGSAYVLLHHVFGEAAGVPGAWGHAIGGMGAITQAMQRACEGQGVEIITDAPVEEIITNNDKKLRVMAKVKGVDLTYLAKTVASSVHPKILFEKLVAADALPSDFRTRIKNYKSHSGTFRMNVALNELPKFTSAPTTKPESEDYLTSGIIIAPSLEYMDEAWLTAKAKGWSDEPIIEMLIPSTLDDTLAPKGKHVASLFCQQFAFDFPDNKEWDDVREQVADHIIGTVDKYAPGFAKSVLGRQILSPLDIERKFGLIGGDIFHGRMSLDQLFSARPVLGYGAYRSPIKGLYMCGSGTHPGGGVTGAPGHNAAQVILKDRRKIFT